jgi:hypothetical protein
MFGGCAGLVLMAALLSVSSSAAAQPLQPPELVAPVYEAVLSNLFENNWPTRFDVEQTTVPMWPVSRTTPEWWAEFADLPASLLAQIEFVSYKQVPRGPLGVEFLPAGARLTDRAGLSDDATEWVALSHVLLSPGATDALVYYKHVTRNRPRDAAYVWLTRTNQDTRWKVARVIVHENAWQSLPWTVLSRRDIEVMDGCFKVFGVYERVGSITILRSYRSMGWGNLKDVVTIDVPPELSMKLERTPKTVPIQAMFTGTVNWITPRDASLTIDGFAPSARACHAHKRFWGGWAVDPPGIIFE